MSIYQLAVDGVIKESPTFSEPKYVWRVWIHKPNRVEEAFFTEPEDAKQFAEMKRQNGLIASVSVWSWKFTVEK